MNQNIKKQVGALLLALILLCSNVPSAFAGTVLNDLTEQGALTNPAYATREQMLAFLMTAADDYQALPKDQNALTKDLGEGSWTGQKPMTRLETLVLISRLFGPLPKPKGNDARLSPQHVAFMDVPDWANAAVENLRQGGILAATKDNCLHGNEPMTLEEAQRIIRRIWAHLGSNMRDDFYNTINKDWLDHSTIPEGEKENSMVMDLVDKVHKQQIALVQEIIQTPHAQGSNEQRMYDFYHNIVDMKARNAQGVAPLQPYLEAISQAETMPALMQVDRWMAQELGKSSFFTLLLLQSQENRNDISLGIRGFLPYGAKEIYQNPLGAEYQRYQTYLTKLLVLSGESSETAKDQVKAYMDMEATLYQSMPEDQEEMAAYTPYRMKNLQAMIPQGNPQALIAAMDYVVPDKLLVANFTAFQAWGQYLEPAHLDLLKIVAKLKLLQDNASYLSQDFLDAVATYKGQKIKILTPKTLEQEALGQILEHLSFCLDQKYVARYCSPAVKEDVEKMVQGLIAVYQERIKGLTWMSAATKREALQKLNTMQIQVAYPDTWENTLPPVNIKGLAEGGSYMANMAALERHKVKQNVQKQKNLVPHNAWALSPMTVNAGYKPTGNLMAIPAAMLQAPFYDGKAKLEANLGGIGTIIAHEITHAFDSTGAQYDEKGRAVNWWTQEDADNFQKLCQQVVDFYAGQEIAPNVYVDGVQTLNENIADIGGMACVLQMLKQLENPDYDAFFRHYAQVRVSTSASLTHLVQDVHSPMSLRVNRVLVNFAEFYETYGIREADGMYVAPKDRIHIW